MSHGRTTPRLPLDKRRGGVAEPAAGRTHIHIRRFGSRRGRAGRIVLAAAAAAVLSSCASVGGTAAVPTPSLSIPTSIPSAVTSLSASASSSQAASSASPSPSPSASASPSASSSSSAGATASRTGAIAGVPFSTPLADTELITTRNEDHHDNLFVIDTVTGQVGKQITKDAPGSQYPTIAPGRGSIVYLQGGDGNVLRMMAADGSGDRPLLAADADFCHGPQRPAWNPVDTSEIAVACRGGEEGNKLVLIGVDGTLRSTINTGLASFDDPTYSPDGKTLAFWGSQEEGAGGGALYLQPANGSGPPRQITTPGQRANDVDPVWSVDGQTIFFRRATEDAGGGQSAQILRVNADGSALTPISDGTAFDQDPTVSPDGKQIAFLSNRTNAAGNNDHQIWVINIDGTGLRQVGIGKPGHANGAPEWGRR